MSMDSKKRNEIEKKLSDLTVIELRKLARERSIDISGAIRKKELIDKILVWDKAPKIGTILMPEKDISEAEAPEELKTEGEVVLESEKLERGKLTEGPKISAKTKEEEKLVEIREYIRFMEGNRPSFFGIDGLLEGVTTKYGTGDYYGAIQAIKTVRERASDFYSHFRIFTNALGIDASERLLEEAVRRGTLSQERANKLVKTAMFGFVEGSPKKREETLEQLENGALEAFDKIIGNLDKDLKIYHQRANELKEIGADVVEAIRLLTEAEKLKTALKLQEAKEQLNSAKNLLKQVEKVRLEEIRYAIPRVRSAIEEAKSIGIDITEPEKELKKASYYIERGEIKLCVESLTKSESVVDQMQHAKLSTDPALRTSQLEKARKITKQLSPFLTDVGSYGIDISEVMHYLRNAQIAITHGDSINAPKFARRADELAKSFVKELEKLKKRSIHLDDERCERCGQEMLYKFDTGIKRCANCGFNKAYDAKEQQ